MILSHNDINIVAQCIQQHYGSKLNSSNATMMSNYGWSHPVLNLIDYILSLNRDYYGFAKPRVKKFKKGHPEIITLQHLHGLISKYGNPAVFFRRELDYDDSGRSKVFCGVLSRLIDIAKQFPGNNELQKIGSWAHSVSLANYKYFGVAGFGLAGFQYLRMLFGVDTVKPDRYIKDFVKNCLGRGVSEMKALCLVEEAAKSIGHSPRQVDSLIWEDYARNSSDKHLRRKKRC